MTAGLSTDVIVGGRPGAAAGRTTFAALAARETRRFALNPVFLFAVPRSSPFSLWAGSGRREHRDRGPPTRIRRSSSAGSA